MHKILNHSFFSPFFSIVITLLVSSIVLQLMGYSAITFLSIYFIHPFASLYEVMEVLMKGSILAIIAFGLSFGFRANIWNIGAEGQFILGGIGGSLVALYFHQSEGFYIIPLMFLSAILGGVLWASIPAFLKTRFNTNEILTSLMLVYVAELLLSFLVHGPLKDPDGLNFPQSVYFSDSALFPILLEETRLSLAVIVALLLLPIVYLIVFKTFIGFQLRVLGLSPKTAVYAGYNKNRLVWFSFIVCGGLTGVAAINEVSSNIGQLLPVISPGYGFTAIIVAFLGRLHPVGMTLAALLMALVYIGSESMQIEMGLPLSIGYIFQGMLLFSLLAADYLVDIIKQNIKKTV